MPKAARNWKILMQILTQSYIVFRIESLTLGGLVVCVIIMAAIDVGEIVMCGIVRPPLY